MVSNRGKTFFFKLGAIEDFGRRINRKIKGYDRIMETRMNQATNLVWRTAHQKRPMITVKQAKIEAKFNPFVYRIPGTKKWKRVSDPNASHGVPVDTGRLQAGIRKKVTKTGHGKYIGEIWVDGNQIPYARTMEFGGGSIRARPFIRPAYAINKERLKQLFHAQAELK